MLLSVSRNLSFINAKLEKNVNLIQTSHCLIDCFADKNKIPTDFKISEDL